MPGLLNRERASAYMADIGIDAMILTQPESITYATGYHPGVATISRRATAGMLLVPADPQSPLAAIIGDGEAAEFSRRSGIADVRGHPVWFDCAILPPEVSRDKSPAGHLIGVNPDNANLVERPAQFWPEKALQILADLVFERGYSKARVGLELTFVPTIDMPLFELAMPNTTWVDASHVMSRLRAIKEPKEIELLRRAAFLSDAGLYHVREKIAPGHIAADLNRLWRAGIDAQSASDGKAGADRTWAQISIGPKVFAEGGPMKRGDVVRLDMGVIIEGYSSDVARTWVHGEPSVAQSTVYDALRTTYDACLPMLKPGTPICDIHAKATKLMHGKGFSKYVRGHYGHGLGASVFFEEWPFISRDETMVLEENMVIAFELPYYIDGLGNFNVEDQMVITRDGFETMYTFDMDFLRV